MINGGRGRIWASNSLRGGVGLRYNLGPSHKTRALRFNDFKSLGWANNKVEMGGITRDIKDVNRSVGPWAKSNEGGVSGLGSSPGCWAQHETTR